MFWKETRTYLATWSTASAEQRLLAGPLWGALFRRPPDNEKRQLKLAVGRLHANAVLVLKVYDRFMPSQQERDKWERLAHLQDEEAAGNTEVSCTGACAPPRNDMSQPQSSDWLTNSRGGTRTRDPGIMSAVL